MWCRDCWRRPAGSRIESRRCTSSTAWRAVARQPSAVHLARQLSDRYPDAALFSTCAGMARRPGSSRRVPWSPCFDSLAVPADRIPVEFDDRVELWRRELGRRRSAVVRQRREQRTDALSCRPCRTTVVLVTSRRRSVPPGCRPVRTSSAPEPTKGMDLLSLSVGRDRGRPSRRRPPRWYGGAVTFPLAIRLAGSRLAHRPARSWRLAALLAADPPALHQLEARDRTLARAFAASYGPLPESDQAGLPDAEPPSR